MFTVVVVMSNASISQFAVPLSLSSNPPIQPSYSPESNKFLSSYDGVMKARTEGETELSFRPPLINRLIKIIFNCLITRQARVGPKNVKKKKYRTWKGSSQ